MWLLELLLVVATYKSKVLVRLICCCRGITINYVRCLAVSISPTRPMWVLAKTAALLESGLKLYSAVCVVVFAAPTCYNNRDEYRTNPQRIPEIF